MQHSLYVVEHVVSGRCYVGWTSKPTTERWANHRGYARAVGKTYFHKALRKHGPDAFEWFVVQHFDTDGEARAAEIYWIDRLRTFGVRLYNLTDGGDGILGHRHSEEARAKMRRPKSLEHRAKLRAANLGKSSSTKGCRLSEEMKAKLSAAKKGKPSPRRGVPMSEEQKLRLADKLRQPKTPEHREKLRAANLGKSSRGSGWRHSEEAKEKIRQAALARRRGG